MTPHRSTPGGFSVQANQKPDGLLKVFPGGFPFSDVSRCHPSVGPQLCSSITDYGVSWAIQALVFVSFVNWPSEPLWVWVEAKWKRSVNKKRALKGRATCSRNIPTSSWAASVCSWAHICLLEVSCYLSVGLCILYAGHTLSKLSQPMSGHREGPRTRTFPFSVEGVSWSPNFFIWCGDPLTFTVVLASPAEGIRNSRFQASLTQSSSFSKMTRTVLWTLATCLTPSLSPSWAFPRKFHPHPLPTSDSQRTDTDTFARQPCCVH